MSITIHGQWVLASGSKHRAKQLISAGIHAQLISPDCDETPVGGESPQSRAIRLANSKAGSVVNRCPEGSIIIAGDQVAHINGQLLRKPGSVERAIEQLSASSGQWVSFESAVAVVHHGQSCCELATTRVKFRTLNPDMIERYIKAERPLDSAGSFYSEAVGGWLIDAVDSDDPTALVGLPMLTLGRLLRSVGADPLAGLPGD